MPRPVDVHVAQADVVEPVLVVQRAQHLLAGDLRRAVERAVVERVVLVIGVATRVAVHRRRRGVDEPLDPGGAARLDDVECAGDVDLDGRARVVQALAEPQRGEVKDVIGVRHRAGRARRGRGSSPSITAGARRRRRREVGAGAADEVVEHGDARRPARRRSRSTTCEPMNPAPPMTSTCDPSSVGTALDFNLPGMWEPQGLIFAPDRERWWQRSHAALPTALALGGPRYRVYFTSRDERGRSHVGWFDLDVDRLDVLDRSRDPCWRPGRAGTSTATACGARPPWPSATRCGCTRSAGTSARRRPVLPEHRTGGQQDGGRTFTKRGRAPLLTAPTTTRGWSPARTSCASGRGAGACGTCPARAGRATDRSTTSSTRHPVDGLAWRTGRPRLPRPPRRDERNIARTCVCRRRRLSGLVLSSDRGRATDSGTRSRRDGLAWERIDPDSGLDGTVAYPFVITRPDRLVLLYNGDGFGRDGIGIALASR